MLEQTPERNKKDEMKENPRLLNKAKAAHKPGAPVRKTRKATTVAVTIAVSFSLLFCTRAEGQDPNTDARSSDSDLQRQILQLRALVQELQSRVSELEKHSALRQEEGTEPGSPEASTEAARSPRPRLTCFAVPPSICSLMVTTVTTSTIRLAA
jgi:cell division protein FtsB